MPTKQSKYEWTKAAKPSTESRPLSPQMLSKFGKLLGMIGEADLAAKLPKRFAITDWDSKLSQTVKAKLTKLRAEYVKHPSHRRKVAWVKSIGVLMDRFASQEEGSKDGKPVAKPKASKAKKAKAPAKAEPSPDLEALIAKAVAAALAAQA